MREIVPIPAHEVDSRLGITDIVLVVNWYGERFYFGPFADEAEKASFKRLLIDESAGEA